MLTPILVDCTGRDGSTLMMRLLATSHEIAVPGPYPYEKKYFGYLWRWSRMPDRRDRNEWWSDIDLASLTHEAGKPLLGPPPWGSTLLGPDADADPSFSRQMFDHAWRELSRRATQQVRTEHHDPHADVRYYAEKHLDTWLLDLGELPELQVVVLLRDPRDIFVSFQAFDAKRRREQGGEFLAAQPAPWESEDDRVGRFLERERKRMRWIASLGSADGDFPVFRYEDMVTDLVGQARRLEGRLGVGLDPDAAAGDVKIRDLHVSAATPEASVGRWRQEMQPELAQRFNRELGDELAALGYPADGAEAHRGASQAPRR